MCEFYFDRVGFFGHVVSANGIYIDPKKVEAVLNWERPIIMIGAQSFLVLASYYYPFVEKLSKITPPFHLFDS